MQDDTSPAAILLITDSLSRIIGFGSVGAVWSSGIAGLGAKWRESQVRRVHERWSKREKFVVKDKYSKARLHQAGEGGSQVVK